MKYITLLYFACIVIVSCHPIKSTSFINDMQQDNIRGPAMRIITKTYMVNPKTNNNQLIQTIIDDVDRKGFLTQDSIVDIASKQVTKSLFIYNTGKLMAINTLLDGKKNGSEVYVYGSDGNLSALKNYDSTGKLVLYYTKIKLNSFGLLVSTCSYKANGEMIHYYENHYKGTQLVSGFMKNAMSNITYRFNTILNEAQDPIRFKEISTINGSPKSTILNYSYTRFDKHKNWVEQICYVDKKPFKITYRIISYYQ